LAQGKSIAAKIVDLKNENGKGTKVELLLDYQ